MDTLGGYTWNPWCLVTFKEVTERGDTGDDDDDDDDDKYQ